MCARDRVDDGVGRWQLDNPELEVSEPEPMGGAPERLEGNPLADECEASMDSAQATFNTPPSVTVRTIQSGG